MLYSSFDNAINYKWLDSLATNYHFLASSDEIFLQIFPSNRADCDDSSAREEVVRQAQIPQKHSPQLPLAADFVARFDSLTSLALW